MEMPEFLHGQAAHAASLNAIAAERRSLWTAVLGLQPKLDGDMWCILWGEDLQTGVSGFGNTPEAAIYAFELEMGNARNKQLAKGPV